MESRGDEWKAPKPLLAFSISVPKEELAAARGTPRLRSVRRLTPSLLSPANVECGT
jgi:hypothetical protein